MVTYAPVYVEAPAVAPLPFGLLSAAQVIDSDDPRIGLGIQYESDYCGEALDSIGICEDLGTLSVSVDGSRHATIDTTGAPDGTFYVLWGDEAPGTDPAAVTTIDGAAHTYAAAGDYVILVTGPRSYRAGVTVHVNNASTSGPFDATVSVSKVETDGILTVEGVPFAIHHLFKCKAPGSYARGAERARRSLQMGESRALERVLARQIARDPNTVDLTSGGAAVHPVDGLAILEQYLGANYPGVGVIHASRSTATRLGGFGTVDRYGDHLETKIGGQRVAAGGGYGPLLAPNSVLASPLADNADGTDYLYGTGAVVVHRTAMIEVGPQIGTSPANNDFLALAERVCVLTYECVSAAVKVHATYEVPTS